MKVMKEQENCQCGFHPSSGMKRRIMVCIAALLLLTGGIWSAKESGIRTDARMRRDLARQVMALAATFPVDEARALSFGRNDESRCEFRQLGLHLKAYAEAAGLRSVFTIALRDGQLLFGPKSYNPSEPPGAPAGSVYQQPPEKLLKIFQTGKPDVYGPYKDPYGRFVTAAAPVMDPRSGQILLTVAMDVDPYAWQAKVRRAQWIPVSFTLIPLLLLAAGYLLMEWRLSLATERHRWMHHLEEITCAVIMLLLMAGACGLVHHAEKLSREDSFHALALFKAKAIEGSVSTLETSLNKLARLFESDSPVSREDFSSCNRFLVKQGLVTACAWLPAVSAADATKFTANERADGTLDFSIWQLNGQNEPEPARGDLLYPVVYIDSLSDSGKTVGYDALSDARLRTAIQEALRTGRAAASEPFRLTMLADAPTGFFVFKPVAGKRHPGMAAFAVQADSLLSDPERTHYAATPDFGMNLFELRAGGPPRALLCPENPVGQNGWQSVQSGLHLTLPVFAFGKLYGLSITPGTRWLEAHPLHNGRIALFFGLTLTLLLTALLSLLTRRSAELKTVVQRRTAALRDRDEKYALLAENCGVILWEYDLTADRWTYVSPQAEQLLGFKPKEWTDLAFWESRIHEGDREQTIACCTAGIHRGEDHDFEYRFIAKDGRTVWLRDVVRVTMEAGRPVRLSGFTIDISDRKQAENILQSRNEELEQFNRAATGRELRMIELKQEINDLRRQQGQEAPYVIPDAEAEPTRREPKKKGRLKNRFGRSRPHES